MSYPFSPFLDGEAARILDDWQRNTRRVVKPAGREPLAGGKSGASLIPVYVEADGSAFGAILKRCPSDVDGVAREPGRHVEALQVSPTGFVDAHLVPQLFEPIALPDHGALVFQRVAHADLDRIATLRAALRHPSLPRACEIITLAILGDWNRPGRGVPPVTIDVVSPETFLTVVLDHRLQPGRPLRRWLEAQPRIWQPRSIHLPRGGLVNPIALLRSTGPLARLEVPFTRGLAHGDLHIDNIIVFQTLAEADLAGFRLVDLSAFAVDAPLVRDPHLLMLSVVGQHLATLDGPARRQLVHVLLGTAEKRSPWLPAGLVAAIESIREAGREWYRAHDREHDWRPESLMALVACALIFIGRDHGKDATAAEWFFDLAASAATAFVSETSTGWTRPVRLVEPPPRPAVPPATLAENLPATAAPAVVPPPQPEPRPESGPRPAPRLTADHRRRLADDLRLVPEVATIAGLRRLIADLPDPVPAMAEQDGSWQVIAMDMFARIDAYAHQGTWAAFVASVRAHCGDPAHPNIDQLVRRIQSMGRPAE